MDSYLAQYMPDLAVFEIAEREAMKKIDSFGIGCSENRLEYYAKFQGRDLQLPFYRCAIRTNKEIDILGEYTRFQSLQFPGDLHYYYVCISTNKEQIIIRSNTESVVEIVGIGV